MSDEPLDIQNAIRSDELIGAALLRYLEEYAVGIVYEMGEWQGWHVWHWRGNDVPRIRPIPCATLDEAITVALAKAAENTQKPRSKWDDDTA
jgi:hypothetical protein